MIDRAPRPSFLERQTLPLQPPTERYRPRVSLVALLSLFVASVLVGLLLAISLVVARDGWPWP